MHICILCEYINPILLVPFWVFSGNAVKQ